jgi:uncharacterized membrane protein YdbT with pleckstrin-like domain
MDGVHSDLLIYILSGTRWLGIIALCVPGYWFHDHFAIVLAIAMIVVVITILIGLVYHDGFDLLSTDTAKESICRS